MKSSKIYNCASHALLVAWIMILLLKTKNHGIPMTEMEFSLPIIIIIPLAFIVDLVIKLKSGARH